MVDLAVIGTSEGNGHPYSFSAIVNGYDGGRVRKAGWGAIADYLDAREVSEFGIEGVRVTHAWCPSRQEAGRLCAATYIENAVAELSDLYGVVDGVLLARDDWRSHAPIALPFLEAGMSVFVDKPLSLDAGEVGAFEPFLYSGQLMTCSGLRYAPELDSLRLALRSDRPLLLNGVGPRDWERYGLHLLEPLLDLAGVLPSAFSAPQAGHDAVAITLEDGSLITVHCMGDVTPGFILSIVTQSGKVYTTPLVDRFAAFRRLLLSFVEMIRDRRPAIDPPSTLRALDALRSGADALRTRGSG